MRRIGGPSADVRGSPKLLFLKRMVADAFSAVVRRNPLISASLATDWLQSQRCVPAWKARCSMGTLPSENMSGVRMVAQGDEMRAAPDLFTPLIPVDQMHPGFIHLARDRVFIPARAIIKEMMPHFTDVDGNFVREFQSRGFDARIWELYLFGYLDISNRRTCLRTKVGPDSGSNALHFSELPNRALMPAIQPKRRCRHPERHGAVDACDGDAAEGGGEVVRSRA